MGSGNESIKRRRGIFYFMTNNQNTKWLLKLNLVSREDGNRVIGSMETTFKTIGEAERYVRDLIASGVCIESYSPDKNLKIIEAGTQITDLT